MNDDTVYQGVTLGLDTGDLQFLGRVQPVSRPSFLDLFRSAGVPLRDVVEEMK